MYHLSVAGQYDAWNRTPLQLERIDSEAVQFK